MIENGILPEFQEFLISNKLAPERHAPFLAMWADKFLRFCENQCDANIELVIAQFLKSLESRDEIKDWQVKQAEQAVRLYLNHYNGNPGLSAAKETAPPDADLAECSKLLEEMKRLIRLKHFAYNTELTYLDWVQRFLAFVRETTGTDAPAVLTSDHARNYLSHLAITRRVSSSTQNQALCALVFLFREVLGRELGDISGMIWAKRGKKLPVVLTPDEMKSLLRHIEGTPRLTALLLYGSGLRLMELARLRVQDIDFDSDLIIVRNGKGDKDRSTVLPGAAKSLLKEHLTKVKVISPVA